MDRVEVIKTVIEKKQAQNYLEIGVFTGACFLQIGAPHKFAVDPDFRIPWEVRKDTLIKKLKRRLLNTFESYFKVTSDQFFVDETALLKKYPLDVVFIDGLHTYGQTIKDVTNALKFLKDDGVIILHDCNPESETVAYPAGSYSEAEAMKLPNWNGGWSGDVWKTIVHLKSTRDDLYIFVLDTDCGLGVITKRKSQKLSLFREADLPQLKYAELEKNRQTVLNLKPLSYLPEFLSTLN